MRAVARGVAGMKLGRRGFFPNLADEPQPLARQCLDQSLPVAGIADRGARRVDPVEQRGFRHSAAMPDRVQEIVLADHTITVLNEMNEQIENLGLDGYKSRSSAQFAAIGVERTILEQIAQLRRSRSPDGVQLRLAQRA